MGTYVYLWVKYFKNVLKYKYLSINTYRYLSTSTQVHEQYLSTYLSTDVLKYSSSLIFCLTHAIITRAWPGGLQGWVGLITDSVKQVGPKNQ